MRNFSNLENKLKELIKRAEFSGSEYDSISDYIEHREYGLAFEIAIDILIEQNKKLDLKTYNLALSIEKMMQPDLGETMLELLKPS